MKRRRPFDLNKKQDSLRKQPIFSNATTGSPQNDVWGTRAEIPYPDELLPADLDSACDCFNQSKALHSSG